MAHALSITDGTTTFSLSTTNTYLQQYVPVEPQPGEQYVSEFRPESRYIVAQVRPEAITFVEVTTRIVTYRPDEVEDYMKRVKQP